MLKERTAEVESLIIFVPLSLGLDISPPELDASIRQSILDHARREIDGQYPGRAIWHLEIRDIVDRHSQPMQDFIEGKPERRMLVATVKYALAPE
jgi:hypothetical protein